VDFQSLEPSPWGGNPHREKANLQPVNSEDWAAKERNIREKRKCASIGAKVR